MLPDSVWGRPTCPNRRTAANTPTYPVAVTFEVVGGNRLDGTVRVPGAKNSILKLMAAALLAEGATTLTEVPDIPKTSSGKRRLTVALPKAPPGA